MDEAQARARLAAERAEVADLLGGIESFAHSRTRTNSYDA